MTKKLKCSKTVDEKNSVWVRTPTTLGSPIIL